MSTMTAPVQTDTAAWEETRLGKFTASTIGKLMQEPKSLSVAFMVEHAHLVTDMQMFTALKSGPRKGEPRLTPGFADKLKEACQAQGVPMFGEGAMQLIADKAMERITGRPTAQVSTRSMDRGTILEYGAAILLSRYWKTIERITWQGYGDNSGATPDGQVERGTESLDIKCKEATSELALFNRSVPDGDFEALESWNKLEAWQIMHQAKCCGMKYANLVYFTDRWARQIITDEERREVQYDMDEAANLLGNIRGYPIGYQFERDPNSGVYGFAYVAKRFELTEERSNRIDRVLKAAESECLITMASMA